MGFLFVMWDKHLYGDFELSPHHSWKSMSFLLMCFRNVCQMSINHQYMDLFLASEFWAISVVTLLLWYFDWYSFVVYFWSQVVWLCVCWSKPGSRSTGVWSTGGKPGLELGSLGVVIYPVSAGVGGHRNQTSTWQGQAWSLFLWALISGLRPGVLFWFWSVSETWDSVSRSWLWAVLKSGVYLDPGAAGVRLRL